ncbi:MAG: hypothetical protein J6B57_04510 [Oscillospiraceae bacterium]|nr:hypothetical protein [Oscillospiraceae bacterium]
MKKYLNKFISLLLSAVLTLTAVPAASMAAFAATSEAGGSGTSESGEDNKGLSLSPVVVSYNIYSSQNKVINDIYPNITTFRLKLRIKDIKVKTSQVKDAGDIDFIKTMDSFKATYESMKILSQGDKLLEYEVVLNSCRWVGDDKSFGFKVGYTGGSDYVDGSVNLLECKVPEKNDEPEVPDPVNPEPIIKITAIEPDKPIKAGDEGEFKIRLKNLGATAAYNILAEVTPSEEILIKGGTGTQDIESLPFKEEKTITIKYKALEKINTEKQNFTVSLKYYYSTGSTETTGSTSAQVAVAAEVSTVETVYPVVEASFSMAEADIDPDSNYSAVLTIKNSGTADMKGLFVKFAGSDDIVVTDGSSSRYFEDIPMGTQKQITMKFRTMKDITAIRQTITATLKYTYVMGNEEKEGSFEETYIMFGQKAEETAPLPIISSKPLDYDLEAGKSYRKAFFVVNKGNEDMQNVTVRVKGGEGVNITGGTDSFYVDAIKAGAEKRFLVRFDTSADLTSVTQTLDIEIEYRYDKSGTMTAETKTGSVSMNSELSTAPVLRIFGEKQEEALTADKEYEYKITVRNYGDITVRDVFIDLTGTDAFYFLDGTESAYIDIIRPQDDATIKVKFKTLEDITSAKQGITAAMKYSYGRNTSIKQGESSSSAVLIAAPNKAEDGKDTGAAPNIIIGKYDIGADQIAAGDVFTLDVDFYNTNGSTAVENMVMTVNAGGDLSIYGGSSSFYYAHMPAAGAASESIQLRALPTAATGTSSVSISFKYDYIVGDTRTSTTSEQTIYVPLYQPDKLSLSVSKPTYDIYVGNEVYITLSYMNKGRADASNVKVEVVSASGGTDEGTVDDNANSGVMTAESGNIAGGSTGETAMSDMAYQNYAIMDDGIMYDDGGAMGNAGYDYGTGDSGDYSDPGYTALNTEKVIGNIAAGGNGTADFVITPTRAGEVSFVLKVTYEDSNMNEIVKELPVTLNVQEQQWDTPDYPMTMEVPDDETGTFPTWIFFVGGGVLVAAAVVVIIVVVRKKKKGGKKLTADDIDWEDELDEDEKSDSNDKTKV